MSEIEKLNMIAEWQEQHKQLIEDLNNSKKRITELEKENAELKKARDNCEQQYQYKVAELGVEVSNLIKAKEIIKKIEKIFYNGEEALKRLSKISDIIEEAEQFLKEVEK